MSNMRNTGKAKPTPADWQQHITGFLRHLAAKGSPATTRNTRRQQLERAARHLHPLTPDAVTIDHVTDYLAAQHWSVETLRGHRNAIVSFFGWMVRTGRLQHDPTADLPHVPAPAPAPRPTPDRVLNAAIADTADPRTLLMLRLACNLGLRRAEVASIHSDDVIDGDTGTNLRVHGKGNKVRLVPIDDDLANLLERGPAAWDTTAPRTGGYVFPGQRDGHLSPEYVGKLCAAAMPGAWTMHSLRHRFATRAYRGSRNLRAVQELLGHTSVGTTQRYTAVNDDELRAAMRSAA